MLMNIGGRGANRRSMVGLGSKIMLRIGAIFIAACRVAIAASLGAMAYLGLRLDLTSSALVALAALVALIMFDRVGSRVNDRITADHIADLSRGTADLARELADVSRRLNAIESRMDGSPDRALGGELLATEFGELSGLVQQLAHTLATHEAALRQGGALPEPAAVRTTEGPLALTEKDAVNRAGCFSGMGRADVIDLVRRAIEENRIELHLQPVVTLPQRRVRYYEAVSRLRLADGKVIAAGDFLGYAEHSDLMPKIDNLLLFRCVQVARRLQMKNREIGLFCNMSAATLNDSSAFRQVLDFMQANRVLAGAISFEFKESDYRNFGPIEREGLAALAECGFRFSLDHVADLRMKPKDLADNGVRFLKVPAKLLLNHAVNTQSDIHPEDLANLLARSGIDLIAECIEDENTVLDLLDYDVRFGQGFLFSPPRPVRPEVLQSVPTSEGLQSLELAGAAG